MRPIVALVLVIILVAGIFAASPGSTAAQQPTPILTTTTISGGGLPHSIQLSPADHDAFMRRLDLPPLFDDPPEVKGPSYTVASPYWDAGIRAGDNTQVLVDDDAVYYPEGGFVKTTQAGDVIWTALDTKQRAILDRYIRYAPSLPAQPTVFEVIRAAGLAGDDIGITVGAVEMTKEQRTKFWDNVRGLKPQAAPASAQSLDPNSPDIIWVEFSLPEGRSIPMAYSTTGGTFSTLTASMTEGTVFPVPRDWLVPVLGDEARLNAPSSLLAPVAISEDATDGSPIWWLITIGGGTASIAIAIVLERKLRSLRATQSS
jgi:hypothetical protein